MPEYYNVTTNLGDAEIANAIVANTKLNITHIAFGDGNGSVPTPTKTRTSLVREVHRQAVTKYERHATNANWIVIETIIPSDIGGFTIREMGIIANGKLISHGSHAPFEKVVDPSGVSEYRLRFTQNVTDGSVVELTLDESLIYATQAWIDENYIKRSEIVDNLTTNEPAKPVSAKQAKVLQDTKLGKTENAASATKLQTARTIGGVSFDGSANINLPGVNASGNQNTSGNAASATKLQTARTIGGVSFDGSANINLPGVNASGNQNTSGNAESATKLQTARTIGGVSFDGSANINLPGVNASGNQNTSGNAESATKLQTARTIGGVSFDGSANINLPGVNASGNQNTSGNAESATKLQTARTIGGVSFDGSANINLPGVNTAGNQNTTGNAATATTAAACSGNAATATKLATARTLSISGDATGSSSFDGSGNISTELTLVASGVIAGTYKSVTVDAKGRVTAATDVVTGLITSATASGTTNIATTNANTFLNITEKVGTATASTGTSTQITGTGTVTVSSDAAGKITITGAQSITGNAATATKLETARTINGVNFDGTQGITVADATKLPLAGGALTGAVTSTGTLKINNTTASTSAETGAFTTTGGLGVAKDLFVGGAISGALLSANSANLNVVTGTGYTITYDYATRLAHIQMRVFTNQSIYLGLPYSGSYALLNLRDVTLPITLRKRLHTQAFFTTVDAAGIGQMGEAYEWMWWTPPAGIDGTTDSKVRISARRLMGGSDELCHCDLFVTGYF